MNIALITAGGIGDRMKIDIPKQFLEINGKPLIIYTLEKFQNNSNIDEIIIACLHGWEDILNEYCKKYKITKLKFIVKGGKTGFESIKNMVFKAKEEYSGDNIIIIHDGDRPMVNSEVINDAIDTCKKYGSGIASIPSYDAIFVTDDLISSKEQVNRETVRRIQTPNAFYLKDMYDMYVEAEKKGIENSVAAVTLAIELGRKVFFSKGSDDNVKITVQNDLDIFKLLIKKNR